MEETLKDVVEILLDDGEDSEIDINDFLSFYNITYNKDHSLESKIYLTACCGYLYSHVCRLGRLRDVDIEILSRAYMNSILEMLDAWRKDEEDLLEKATITALVLLTVWTEKAQDNADEELENKVRITTEFVGQVIRDPFRTLLYYACQEQTFDIEDKYREILSSSSGVLKYILKNKIDMVQPARSECLLATLVREAFEKWGYWTQHQKSEAARSAQVLREHGRNKNWEPTEEEILFMQEDLYSALETDD